MKMNAVETLFHESLDQTFFQKVVNDDFSFLDKIIDQRDLDKVTEVNINGIDEN